jgi:hypothetical protein
VNVAWTRRQTARLAAGYGAIAAVLPYLVLKVLWLSGAMVGVPTSSPAHGSGFIGPNVVTAAMDAVAILVALALTHDWGLRLPAWLVLVPIWAATGLLVPAAVEVLNGGLAALLTGGRAVSLQGGLVEPWVYVVVYASFVAQGTLLAAAFVLYARTRWAVLFDRPVPEPGATASLQAVLAAGAAFAALAIAAAHLVMAFGRDGAFGPYRAGWEYTARSGEVVNGSMALLAAGGILVLTRHPAAGRLGRRVPFSAALAMTWTGAGATFTYGLLTVTAVLAGLPDSGVVTPLNRAAQFGALLTGLVIGLTAIFALTELHARPRLVADRASIHDCRAVRAPD